MSQLPYLHPSQRTLRTKQIGASSHKNSYHIGVLEGNWCEDQTNALFDRKNEKAFLGTTQAMVEYKKYSADMTKKAKGDAVPLQETQRELLFSHGSDAHHRQLSTTNEVMCFTNNIRVEQSYNMDAVSNRKVLASLKQAEWAENRDVFSQQFITTKNATIDGTGAHIQQRPDVLFGNGIKQFARSGKFVQSLGKHQGYLRS